MECKIWTNDVDTHIRGARGPNQPTAHPPSKAQQICHKPTILSISPTQPNFYFLFLRNQTYFNLIA